MNFKWGLIALFLMILSSCGSGYSDADPYDPRNNYNDLQPKQHPLLEKKNGTL